MTQHTPFCRNAALSATALLSSVATLVCCVLPAVLVALGAGATLAGIVTAVPQLVWLSTQKPLVFGIAGTLLVESGLSLWQARILPYPVHRQLASSCRMLRRLSWSLYGVAIVCFALGATFAFVIPI